MKPLPDDVRPHRETPVFDQDSVPPGLLGRHTTAEGVWGLIEVLEGRLRYRILEPEVEEHLLEPGHPGVVEPQVPHQVELLGPVRFRVVFHRHPDDQGTS